MRTLDSIDDKAYTEDIFTAANPGKLGNLLLSITTPAIYNMPSRLIEKILDDLESLSTVSNINGNS